MQLEIDVGSQPEHVWDDGCFAWSERRGSRLTDVTVSGVSGDQRCGLDSWCFSVKSAALVRWKGGDSGDSAGRKTLSIEKTNEST